MKLRQIISLLKGYQKFISLLVIALTIILFAFFFVKHPQYRTSLRHVSPWTILTVIALNGLLTLTLAVTSQAILALCGHRLSFKEQLLLTAYSSLANFFGPLQSGPGVRAAYLKTKHNVSLKDYTLASLIGYGMFATISALFLFGGSRPWWQTVIGCFMVVVFSSAVIRLFIKRRARSEKTSTFKLSWQPLLILLAATTVQVIIVTSYYLVELRAIGIQASLRQVVSYSGAANFALFVSLTPDAVGIRESFLVLAKHLHGLSTAAIVTANVLDRAVYAVFLGVLFLIILAVHAKARLGINTSKSTDIVPKIS